MNKITESDYRLPKILALEVQSEFKGGANRPLHILGIDTETHVKDTYVVKHRNGERMGSTTAAVRELMASWLAKELELSTPEPVIIEIDDKIIETERGGDYFSDLDNSRGLNFGCKYLSDCQDYIEEVVFTPEQNQQAAQILAFDALIQQADRKKYGDGGKPNLLFGQNNEVFVIDHELGFSFLMMMSFLQSPNPWEFNDTDEKALRDHVLYSKVFGKRKINKNKIFAPYLNFDPTFWEHAQEHIPHDWDTIEFSRIREHVSQVINNTSTFQSQLCKLLSI